VRLAALEDRGGRELPIAAAFVGAEVSVAEDRQIELTRSAEGRLNLVLNPMPVAD
jgi:pyrimidine operon attenuation protein/uracil phosphoribosyltransferase